MRVEAERLRNALFQLRLDRLWGFALGKARAIANPEYMRVDRKGFLSKGTVHHDVGGFAANTGQRN